MIFLMVAVFLVVPVTLGENSTTILFGTHYLAGWVGTSYRRIEIIV